MAFNLDNALFARAKWQLKLLIPCWTFQIAVLLCLMAIFAYRLAETMEHYSEQKQNGQVPMVEIVWESTNVGFSTLALVCTIIEIAKVATETLTPFAMLCTHVLKLTLAFAMLALDITEYVQRSDYDYSIVGLALDCGFLAVAIGTFVYSLVVFRRLLKYEEYHLADNKHSRHVLANEPYTPNHYRDTTTTTDRLPPIGESDMELGHHNATITISSSSPSAAGRPTSSSSTSQYRDAESIHLKAEVDRRIGAGFGWGAAAVTPPPPLEPSPPSSVSEGGGGVGIDRTTSIVLGQGVVTSRKASPTEGEQLQRSRSHVTERGVVSDEDEDEHEMEDGERRRRRGVLPVVVVEDHERMREGDVDDDRRALLGGR